jgi:hypothetical protein
MDDPENAGFQLCTKDYFFVLPPAIPDGIVAAVSNQCPQGPPIWEFSRLNVAGPKVHNKPGFM